METEQQEASTPVPATGAGEGDLNYEQLLELYEQSMRHLVEGELVSGRVIEITTNDVVVDVGYKSEGLVPRQEFTDHHGEEVADKLGFMKTVPGKRIEKLTYGQLILRRMKKRSRVYLKRSGRNIQRHVMYVMHIV